MRWRTTLVVALTFVTVVGCATSPTPKTVSPEYLARFEGGGSLRTIWYHGSDEQFHYFSVLHKTSTPYRIKKNELKWDQEFLYGSCREATLVGNELSTFVEKQAELERPPESPLRIK
jgi:hypothetical protein